MFVLQNSSEKNGVSLSRLSMRKRSIILFSVLVIFLVTSFCYYVLNSLTMNISNFYKDASEYTVNFNAVSLEKRIADYMSHLENLSRSPILKEKDPVKLSLELSKSEALDDPYIVGVYFSDLQGNVHLPSGKDINIAAYPFCSDLISGKIKSVVSNAAKTPFYKDEIFCVARSIYDGDGAMRGILIVAVNLLAIKNPVSRMAFVESANAFVMDIDGNFLIEPVFDSVIRQFNEDPKKLARRDVEAISNFRESIVRQNQGSLTLNSVSMGVEYISFARILNTKWIIGLVETESNSYREFLEIRSKIIWYCVIFCFLLIAAFAFLTLSGTRGKSSHRLTLQQDSDFDELTGLWTESRFEEECERLLKNNPDTNYMILGIDIRGFRIMQQTDGVAAANEHLIMLAKRLGQIAMQQNGIAARGAIDHLYLMYPVTDKESALKEFNSLLYNGNYFAGRAGERVPTKTGIVFAGKDYEKDTVQNLIAKTSYARHGIRSNLLQNYSVYDAKMEERIIKDKKIERYIPIAFSHKEFYVVYQPKVDLTNGKVIGAEALVRWESPELGLCMPDEFITLFEKNGYINQLDFYVYQQVFEFLSARQKEGKPNVPISVNMSRFHLGDDNFVQKFCDLFERYDIPPQLIEVEIVERSVGTGDDRLLEVTKQLHEKKFRVAIDDFGNGESSLNIISEIPADVLKLDQKFMKSDGTGRPASDDEYKIVAKIVEMAKSLGKETICEGVETEQQIAFLRSVDVNYVQGYYYSRPLKQEDFILYLERNA
ncbi:MAG: GGDEF domain-containing protein [Treponema sp.]|nr:GGDEF domain-containing protein [Treponema sp.]